MEYTLALDTSDNWKYIAGVVILSFYSLNIKPHISSVNKKIRWKIIENILQFVSNGGAYAICLYSNLRSKIRAKAKNSRDKKSLWTKSLTFELRRMADHLRDKNYWPIDRIYADEEFSPFEQCIKSAFKARTIITGKNENIIIADIVAYINFRNRKIIKKYNNIVEL